MKLKYFNLIFFASIFIAISGIFTETMQYFNLVEFGNSKLFYIKFLFQSLYLNIGIEYTSFNIYNLIFYVFLLFGSVFYYATEGKEIRLIRLFFSVLLVTRVLGVFQIILGKLFFNDNIEQIQEDQVQHYFFMIVPILLTAIYVALSFYVLKLLAENRTLDITKNEVSNNYVIKETPKMGRLSHHIIDNLIIVFLCSDVAGFLYYSVMKGNGENVSGFYSSEYAGILLIIVMRLLYFPFFEKIFGATPGKFLTNSRVVNSTSEIPDIRTIITRTLCRFIPFDAFSFFGRKGWHDSLSKTYVVKEKEEGINSIFIKILFIFAFFIAASYTILKYIY